MNVKDINYALVEETRPPLYKAMKYWGKKPHNIWSQYIETYCPQGGMVLDPFAGSGVAAFEAAKIGRRCTALDLNPLTGFFIESLSTPLNEKRFKQAYDSIVASIESDPLYKKHYLTRYRGKEARVYNYRWLRNKVTEVVLQTSTREQARIRARKEDKSKAAEIPRIRIPFWFPTQPLPTSPSITHKFIKDLGGNTFADLWTRRNLYLLAALMDKILEVKERAVRLHLLSAFIQTLHLTCRMVIPRAKATKRDFSGSWGRADYMIRSKSMEQNPLIIFGRSCFGKQGVVAALEDAAIQFPKGISTHSITSSRKSNKRCTINYGTADVADLSKYLQPRSVDFIITDPPYADLVYYLDLSLLWLVWLQGSDTKRFTPDLLAEVIIKDKQISRKEYQRRLTHAFKQMHSVLKDEGKLVVTFHHQKLQVWNDFLDAIRLSGFFIEKVTHQYNKRSGESNVANPYGTSGSDFYIRLSKQAGVDFSNDASGLEHFIVTKSIEVLARRNEPTPYTFIFDGLVPELVQAGHSEFSKARDEVTSILQKNAGRAGIFTVSSNKKSKAGDIWWFNDPSKYISHPDRPLSERVEETIISILRRKVVVKFDDIIAELFRTYPNGLTPDVRTLKPILEKYAFRSSGSWKIKDSANKLSTAHTRTIAQIVKLARRSKHSVFIGRREQPEPLGDGTILRDLATCHSIDHLTEFDAGQLERISMVDALWLTPDGTRIVVAFEVENTTNFTSGIQRASNIGATVQKIMVIPDKRESKLRATKDPHFVTGFQSLNWKYITYSDLDRFASFAKPNMKELSRIAKTLP
jgi:16S rRNA G966 N2-methylase RsmD